MIPKITVLLGLLGFLIVASAEADQLADGRRAFWDKVHCVEIYVYDEIDKEEGPSDAIEREIAARLLTVWRREMPERALARSVVSGEWKKMLSGKPRDYGCEVGIAGKRNWNPTIRIFIRAARMGKSELWYGAVRTSFEMRFDGSVLDLKFFCQDDAKELFRNAPYTGAVLFGPAYRTAGEERPMIPWFQADMSIFHHGGGDPIFANTPRDRIAEIAASAGETLIRGIASVYYKDKIER